MALYMLIPLFTSLATKIVVPAIWAGRGPHVYSISGALIYSVPNNANSAKILNSNQIKGQIALVDRGEIPLISKVKLLQETGAVAVVIVDDGQCGNKLEERHCGLANGKGFAQYDREENWRGVQIPVLLVSFVAGEKIKSMMDLTELSIKGFDQPQLVHREL
eukprot:CAMPEP_0194681500 /NCGR_PEP_ID=MMETSP0295-20121207/12145_1 /TAXON_ID=39354 /ORGANISM="Heterosigma akashiwo, Strain CCMP2393" /LENGTH=161 /DNA_ID=CAMNT_0039567547 /DNA_START=97 /DNA_END=583 /DNA_ORIENTATION=+